jgi:predicted DNA-binding transcriptional regulator YafY
MKKSERLLALMDVLRRQRSPITADQLAQDQGVSERTIYRDILALQNLGAPIDGEAGIGYILRPGFFLPPLAFQREEIEALVLGARWVASQPDAGLAEAAQSALAKIAATSPASAQDQIDEVNIWPALIQQKWERLPTLKLIRLAMREELCLVMCYQDVAGQRTQRTICPVQLFYYEGKQIVAAWCCTRGAFRNFRVDRISELTRTHEVYPTPRRELARAWREEWKRLHPDWYCPAE